MNDFFENITKTVNKTTKKAMKISGNMIELTKTSLNMKYDEAKKGNFYAEIGRTVYEKYTRNPQTADEEIIGFCQCIDEINETINTQKLTLAKIQKQKFCPACGQKLDKSIVFCFACGEKQPEIPPEEDETDDCCSDGDCCCGEENADDDCKCNDDKTDDNCGCNDDGCGCNDDNCCDDDNCGCGE